MSSRRTRTGTRDGAGVADVIEHCVLADGDPDAKNTLAEPERVVSRRVEVALAEASGDLRASSPPLSWNVIRLAAA